MSSNTSCTIDQQNQIISSYASSLSVIYLYLMTPTVLGSLTLPLVLALFYLSNARQRRTPMFICVALAALLQLAQSIQQATIHMRMLYNPIDNTHRVFKDSILVSTLILELSPNFVADIALLFRMLAVYPRAATPTGRWLLIFTPPLVFKAVRVACWAGFLVALTVEPGGQLPHFYWTAEERRWTVVERSFTAVDNAWASGFFLWKLRGAILPRGELGQVSSHGSQNSFASRVRTLFWLSVTNFVIPVPMCFIQVGFAAALKNSIVYEIMQHFINFVSIVCVAFATVWYQSSSLRAAVKESDGAAASPVGPAAIAPIRFRRTQSTAESGMPGTSTNSPATASPASMAEKTQRPLLVDFDRQTTFQMSLNG